MINFKSKFLSGSYRTAILFTSGNFLVAGISAISGLLYGRWIEPETLGEFNKYGILTGYLGLGIVFVDGAFQRHFPYYLGKGDVGKALGIAATANWWYLMLVALGVVVFGSLAVKNLLTGNFNGFFGWLVQIPAYTVATYGLYLKILYRSNDDFRKLNRNMVITSIFGIFTLPLVYFFSFKGLATRSILQNISNVLVHFHNAPYRVKPKFSFKGLTDLARVSFPLQIPVYLDSHLLKATVSLIIVNYLGTESLGIYGMAIMLQGFLLVFSRSLNQIFVTKTMLNYGKHDDFGKTFRYIIKPTLLSALVGVAMVALFNLSIPIAVNFFLPKYNASVLITQILAVELVLALVRSPFTLFISALMYKEMILLRVLKAILTIAMAYFYRDSLVGISLSLIVGGVLFVVFGYVVLFRKVGNN